MTITRFEISAETQAELGARDCPFDWPEIKGVFVGGCVVRGVGSSFRNQAHAHIDPTDEHRGWICVRSHRLIPIRSAVRFLS